MAPDRQVTTTFASQLQRIKVNSVYIVFTLAFVLRITFLLITPAASAFSDDTAWYIRFGTAIVSNTVTPANVQPFPPVYAMLTGTIVNWFGLDIGVKVLQPLQAVLGLLVCVFIWRITFTLTQNQRTALIAALGIALNPIFIIDNSVLLSENLFIFLIFWALSVYIKPEIKGIRTVAATGALLGLASLTRAVLIAFPLGLVIHLMLILPRKQALRAAGVLLICYSLVLSTWTIYNKVKFDRLVIGGYGISDLLITATVGYTSSKDVDTTYAELNNGKVPDDAERDRVATRIFADTITKNPVGYLLKRFRLLSEALLQPHNTVYFPGKSLKESVVNWLNKERSISALGNLLSDRTFWPKLCLYIFHWTGLFLGFIGIFLTRKRWRDFAPLTGLLCYFLLVHLFLLALPRYLFPPMPVFWIFASIALVQIWDTLQNRRLAYRQVEKLA